MDYQEQIINHYEKFWLNKAKIYYWSKGPSNELPYDFRVLEFEPTTTRNMWTYATCCMSQKNDEHKIELHLFSHKQDSSLIELLTMVAYYHRCKSFLNLHHTVNFGKPWQDASLMEYGFISLPYLDGPELMELNIDLQEIKCYWLIPVSKEEVQLKKRQGVEKLEELFETHEFDYLNPSRKSLV